MDYAISLLQLLFSELLLFSAFWFLIGAIDDLLVDLIWIIRRIWRRLRYYSRKPPLTAPDFPAARSSGLMAILVPTWQESAVIGNMLAACHSAWQHSSVAHRIYVGCYRNDPQGIACVMRAAATFPNIVLVLCNHPGPTSKADCLNKLWQALVRDEIASGVRIKGVILHDAEDLAHSDELKLFDRLLEDHPAVQLPVMPLQVPGSRFISGHYCDEFAEAHAKTLPVREAIGASVPLAGVACAIDRNLLGELAVASRQQPFDAASLTEDYELGIKIGKYGQTIMARVQDAAGLPVASRSHFPSSLAAAVRQKSRWMVGIALAGWDRLGWQGGIAQKWMLLRDRKAVFAAIILLCAYLSIIMSGLLLLAWMAGMHTPEPLEPLLETLLLLNLALLCWRMAMRALFVWRLYGWRQGLLSIPRTFVANIIAIMAARRACGLYLRHIFGAKLGWEKTEHSHFPSVSSGKHAA